MTLESSIPYCSSLFIRLLISSSIEWEIITPLARGVIGFIGPKGALMLPKGTIRTWLGTFLK